MTAGRIALGLATFIIASTMFMGIADARKGMIFYHKGPQAFETGPLPEPFDKDERYEGAKAGYKCDAFGFFWAHFTISDCLAIAYAEDGDTINYVDKSDAPELIAAIEKKYSEADMKIGPWGKYGKFVLIFLVLLIVGGGIWAKFRGGSDDDDDD